MKSSEIGKLFCLNNLHFIYTPTWSSFNVSQLTIFGTNNSIVSHECFIEAINVDPFLHLIVYIDQKCDAVRFSFFSIGSIIIIIIKFNNQKER